MATRRLKVAYIVPGSGDAFSCDNCLRDEAFAEPLRRLGHRVIPVPVYLPSGAAGIGSSPLFFGAVGMYVRSRFPRLRSAPWLSRLLDSAPLLGLAARRAGSTRPAGLEELTLSMLRGELGSESAEVERLALWLRDECAPDVVHLSNALLIGLARRIRELCGIPVVCGLQDEVEWIDGMREPYRSNAWEILRERSSDVSHFLPVSAWYGESMRRALSLAPDRLTVVPPGIDVPAYPASMLPLDPPAIGYLSRWSEAQGLGRLVEAFIALRNQGWPRLELRLMGGATSDDRAFLRRLRARLEAAGAARDVQFVHGFGTRARMELLASITLLSIPSSHGEALGTSALEALAAGVPLVQPAGSGSGILAEECAAGVVYDPAPGALECRMADLLRDPTGLRNMAAAGRSCARVRFDVPVVGARLAGVYGRLLCSS